MCLDGIKQERVARSEVAKASRIHMALDLLVGSLDFGFKKEGKYPEQFYKLSSTAVWRMTWSISYTYLTWSPVCLRTFLWSAPQSIFWKMFFWSFEEACN